MSRNTYFFDKRVVKKVLTKFFVSCIAAFPFLLAFNILTTNMFDFWFTVIIDSLILLVFVILGNYIGDKAYEKADIKRAKRRGEYNELQERKRIILQESKKKQEAMQDSYKRIREEKKQKKLEKQNAEATSEEMENLDNDSKLEDNK